MEDRDSAPTQQRGRDGSPPDEESFELSPAKQLGLIFVCDPSAEAERLMGALRSRGYPVVDVLLGLLPSRLRYQVPDLILCDADPPEALDCIRQVRQAPSTEDIRVVFLSNDQDAVQQDPAFQAQKDGVFSRPLDVSQVCSHIEDLIGPPSRDQPSSPSNLAPRRAPVIVPSARKPYRSDEGPSSTRTLDSIAPPSEFGLGSSPRASLIPALAPNEADESPPELSAETRALLDRAHVAASATLAQTSRPTRLVTDNELAGEVDFDVLGALEEPLDASGESEVSGGTAGGAGSDVGHAASSASSSGKPPTAPPPRSYPSEAAVTNPGGKLSQPSMTSGWETTGPTSPPRVATTEHGPPHVSSDAPDSGGSQTATVAPPRRSHESLIGDEEHAPVPSVAFFPPDSFLPATPLDRTFPRSTSSNGVDLDPRRGDLPALRLADLARAPGELRPGVSARALATAIRERLTGALAFQDGSGIRRVVFRDGDIVTAVSGAEHQSLVRFLEVTGDLDARTVDQVARTLPPFGRHAGAGLIAHGHLQQEDLWPVLRAHAEWILASVVGMSSGRVSWEEEVPGRLQDEPAVFGGATGSEVFVEAVRRAVDPPVAWELVGAGHRILGMGRHRGLLGECALEPELEALVQGATDAALEPMYRMRPELLPILYALVELDVLTAGGGGGQPTAAATDREQLDRQTGRRRPVASEEFDDPLDDAAFQARVLARRALVDEGDYFSILGVQRTATEYEINRAHDTLHKQLSPARLTARNAHLLEDLELVLRIIDEAHDILKDTVRRERYRRALEAEPH